MKTDIIRVLPLAALLVLGACENGELEPAEVRVEYIKIDQDDPAVVAVGGTAEFSATVKPDDATDKSVTWESSDRTVATIDKNGLAKGLKTGTVTITARSSRKSIVDECKLEVKVITPATAVSIAPASITVGTGDGALLTATMVPAGSTTTVASWESSRPEVASLTPLAAGKCRVEGKTAGTATVTVTTDNGLTATCAVTVKTTVHATGVSISPASVPALPIGGTATLTATMTPAGATSSLEWKSSDTAVATVTPLSTNTCRVTGAGNGTATITVTTSNGKSATREITVSQPVTSVTLSKTSSTFELWGDNAEELTATVYPANAEDQNVTFSSSNTGVIWVNKLANGNCSVKATGEGTATVTATCGGKTATCTYTVKSTGVEVYWINSTGAIIRNGVSVWRFQSYIKPVAMTVKGGVKFATCNNTQTGRVMLCRVYDSSIRWIDGFENAGAYVDWGNEWGTSYGTADEPDLAYDIYADEEMDRIYVAGFCTKANSGAGWYYDTRTESSVGGDISMRRAVNYAIAVRNSTFYYAGREVSSGTGSDARGVVTYTASTTTPRFTTDYQPIASYPDNYFRDMIHYDGDMYVTWDNYVIRLDTSWKAAGMNIYTGSVLRLAESNGSIYCLTSSGNVYRDKTLIYNMPGATDFAVVDNDVYACGNGRVYRNENYINTQVTQSRILVIKK